MTLGERIVHYRKKMGISQVDLADRLKITPTRLNYWEKDKRKPDVSMLVDICDALSIDGDVLLGRTPSIKKVVSPIDDLSSAEQTHIKKYRVLDTHGKDMVDTVLDKEYDRVMSPAIEEVSGSQAKSSLLFFEFPASAGTGENLPEEEKRYIMMPKRLVPNYADCCIRISGDSMEPDYHDGDIVFVQLIESVPVGSVGIFTLNGAGYIKKLGRNQLISLNPNYAPIPFGNGDSIRCVGRVLGIADKNMIK